MTWPLGAASMPSSRRVPEVNALDVLVALEPASFRDVVSGALRRLRPDVRVHAVEGAGIADVVQAAPPDLVIASRLEEHGFPGLRWLVCVPPSEAVLVAPERTTGLTAFDFWTLLSIVDGLVPGGEEA